MQSLLQEANKSFAQYGDYAKARSLLAKLIRIDSGVPLAWRTLAAVFAHTHKPEKQCHALITAALLEDKDTALWLECGSLCEALSKWMDAEACYRRAHRSLQPVTRENRDQVLQVNWTRYAVAATETRNMSEALDALLVILRHDSGNRMAMRYAAQLYKMQREPARGIALYEADWEKYARYPEPPRGHDVFRWPELVVLADLYAADSRWRRLPLVVSKIARWIRGRAAETFWDACVDDREWDDDNTRRQQVRDFRSVAGAYREDDGASSESHDFLSAYSLPVILHVYLGWARCKSGHVTEGLRHISRLDTLAPEAWSRELALVAIEAAAALAEAGRADEALHLYLKLSELDEVVPEAQHPALYSAMGQLYRQADDTEQAIACFRYVVKFGHDTNASMALAELLEQAGEYEEALDTLHQLRHVHYGEEEGKDQDDESFLARKHSRYDRRQRSQAELREQMEKKTRDITRQFSDIQALFRENKDALSPSLRLLDEFSRVRALFPTDKSSKFRGVHAHRRRLRKSFDEQLEAMVQRLEDALHEELERTHVSALESQADLVYGITHDEWLELYVRSAMMLMAEQRTRDAIELLREAQRANVVYQNKRRFYRVHNALLSCVVRCGDTEDDAVDEVVRWYCFQKPRSSSLTSAYKLWIEVCASVRGPLNLLTHPNTMKFVQRRINAVDAAGTYSPALLLVYGHMLTAKGSIKSALYYYGRCYMLAPEDASVNLSLGISYLHLAMQRMTANRHYQITQALFFLCRYVKIRGKRGPGARQEAEYNMGRAMHHVGLAFAAIPHYERVLAISRAQRDAGRDLGPYDMRYEAAHNLVHIYKCNGDGEAALRVLETELTWT